MECTGGEKLPGDALFTHCRRELFHAQWRDLLDDEFLQAYEHGMAFICGDGIKRRLFPRIFTYSADYPEKYIVLFHRDRFTTQAQAFVPPGYSSQTYAALVVACAQDALFQRKS